MGGVRGVLVGVDDVCEFDVAVVGFVFQGWEDSAWALDTGAVDRWFADSNACAAETSYSGGFAGSIITASFDFESTTR